MKGSEQDQPNIYEALWDAYFEFWEYASRCQMEIKSQGSYLDELWVFYYAPKCVFLEDPDKQKNFWWEFINNASRIPTPEGIYLQGDELYKDFLVSLQCKSFPKQVKEKLTTFFLRRASNF